MTPEDFPRRFAATFAAQDIDALLALFQPDATYASLTGLWAETQADLRATLESEAAGTFKSARLVTGKGTLRDLSPQATLLRQRYTVTGARDEHGSELPRFGAVLVAVLESSDAGWQAQSLTFTALP